MVHGGKDLSASTLISKEGKREVASIYKIKAVQQIKGRQYMLPCF